VHFPQFEGHAAQVVPDKKYPPEHVRQTVELEQVIQPFGQVNAQVLETVKE
jgi:hypothetical protein